jgi:hypothetical protein
MTEVDTKPWYERPLDSRAPAGGEEGVNDKQYKGGQFMPQYVPRPVMPQIDGHDEPKFLVFAAERGITTTVKQIGPGLCMSRQHVDMDRVRAMPEHIQKKPVIVSNDMVILDGNHRWTRHLIDGTQMTAYIVDLPFETAVDLMFAFPKTYDLADAGPQERN